MQQRRNKPLSFLRPLLRALYSRIILIAGLLALLLILTGADQNLSQWKQKTSSLSAVCQKQSPDGTFQCHFTRLKKS